MEGKAARGTILHANLASAQFSSNFPNIALSSLLSACPPARLPEVGRVLGCHLPLIECPENESIAFRYPETEREDYEGRLVGAREA